MKPIFGLTLALALVAGSSAAWAQAVPTAQPVSRITIDCPPVPGAPAAAVATPPSSSTAASGPATSTVQPGAAGTALPRVGTAQSGAGPYRGGDTFSAGAMQRVEGEIQKFDAAARTMQIGTVTLDVPDNSLILVDCREASIRDLREGSKVKAAYQIRDGKNIITVIESAR